MGTEHHVTTPHDVGIPYTAANPSIEILLAQLEIENKRAQEMFNEHSQNNPLLGLSFSFIMSVILCSTFVMIGSLWLLMFQKISTPTMWLIFIPSAMISVGLFYFMNRHENKVRRQFRDKHPSEAKLLWKSYQ